MSTRTRKLSANSSLDGEEVLVASTIELQNHQGKATTTFVFFTSSFSTDIKVKDFKPKYAVDLKIKMTPSNYNLKLSKIF